jgi:Cys-rich repeat protein
MNDCRVGLACDTSVRNGFCTARCMNGQAAQEQIQCGGAGSTCVTNGDPPNSNSFCAQVCTPGPGPGCREGHVCTGFWVSHAMGVPDSPACVPFCQRDLECPAGQVCQTRLGSCGMERLNPMLLADGQPCMRPAMGAPSPCRGVCFNVLNGSPTGVCGSLIDLAITNMCPDGPATPPLGVRGDNLAYCVFRRCGGMNGCCPAGLVCEGNAPADTTGFCTADDPMQPNIPCP